MIDNAKISMRLLNETLSEQIKSLSKTSDNIVITDHAEDRMDERSISYNMVLEILRTGHVEYIEQDKYGNQVAKVTNKTFDYREAGVVTAVIDNKNQLLIITVMWSDPR